MKSFQSFLILTLIILTISAKAQDTIAIQEKAVQKIEIQTSAQCELCKERIEKNMAFEKGVKFVELNLETKVLTLKYRADKTDPEKLKKALSKIGYDADDVPADAEAYAKLPACCQKGGHDHED